MGEDTDGGTRTGMAFPQSDDEEISTDGKVEGQLCPVLHFTCTGILQPVCVCVCVLS